ncbi:MAG: hypothetical protein FWC46_03400, partial [Actinomycetia bacterium]|nr:hypothetical protein [Actinomycetes bacterium]
TTTATTPLDPPDPWTPNPITLTPADGKVTIQIIYPACHGSACQLKFTSTRNGATVPMSPVTATPGGGTYNSGFSGLVPGDVVSVSAQLCNEQVCGPASPTVTGSPLGPPGAWGAGQGSVLYATGNDGELAAQVIYPPCNGTSCTITVTWSGAVSGTDTATARTEGSNYTKMFTGLPNGADVSLHAQLCNEAFCGDVSNTATASAFGPLAAPTLTVTASAGDHTICADAAGNGNGRRAHISLTVDNTKGAQSATVGGSGSGALSGRGCVYVGPSGTATFTATVITDTTSPTRSNSPSVSKGATSPASPPSTITDVSIATFAQNPSTLPASVRVSANNLPPGVQATVTIADWCGSTDLTTCRNNNPQASTTVTTNADGTLSVEMGTNMGQGVAATITINGTTVATWGPETL